MTDDDLTTPAERAWYAAHACGHVHCPHGCEHPQPALTADGRMLCMRCWAADGVVTECLPCVTGVCDD